MIYEFKKGELNKFNNLNQDLKTIFDYYYIYNDSQYVFGEAKLHKGKHFVCTSFKMFFEHPNCALRFCSQQIFEAISKNKSKIKYITIIDSCIYLGGDIDLIRIGQMIDLKSTDSDMSMYNTINTEHVNDIITEQLSSHIIHLTDEGIKDLVSNEFINVSENRYRTRITKEVIPGLKKSHEVGLWFSKHTKDSSLFYLTIIVERNNCTSYHRYTCLYM